MKTDATMNNPRLWLGLTVGGLRSGDRWHALTTPALVQIVLWALGEGFSGIMLWQPFGSTFYDEQADPEFARHRNRNMTPTIAGAELPPEVHAVIEMCRAAGIPIGCYDGSSKVVTFGDYTPGRTQMEHLTPALLPYVSQVNNWIQRQGFTHIFHDAVNHLTLAADPATEYRYPFEPMYAGEPRPEIEDAHERFFAAAKAGASNVVHGFEPSPHPLWSAEFVESHPYLRLISPEHTQVLHRPKASDLDPMHGPSERMAMLGTGWGLHGLDEIRMAHRDLTARGWSTVVSWWTLKRALRAENLSIPGVPAHIV